MFPDISSFAIVRGAKRNLSSLEIKFILIFLPDEQEMSLGKTIGTLSKKVTVNFTINIFEYCALE